MKIKIIFLVQSIVLILLLSGCENEQLDLEREEIIRPVKTMTVKYPEQNSWREFPAVVESARQAELSFKIKGTLKSLKVKESQKVDKGQILAELDTTDYQIELNSAKAEFETAQANYKRGQQLIERKVISQADFDELRSKFVSAKSKLETAKQNIIYTQLRAPFSGEITKRFIDTYMEVAPQQPIYNLQDLSLIQYFS